MRRLMLLRHSKAERAAPGEPDRDRTLTNRGRTDAPAIGTYMSRHGFVPELALVSPAKRAQETWALLATTFSKQPKSATDERIYNATSETLAEIIGETRTARSILVVGHNPGLHDVAVQLIASGDTEARGRVAEKLPTSGLIIIDLPFDDWALLHPASGRIERFVTPRSLAGAAD
jgi:phosphohistidine phosphatase